jgi:hypothetical protein
MSIIVNIIIRNISIIEFCVSIILYFSLPLVTYHFFTSNIKKCIVK